MPPVGAKVDPERQLTVGPRRYEVVPPALATDAGQEAGDDVAALIFEWDRWHGDADIGGEQADQRLDVPRVVPADELCHEGPLGGRGGSRSRFALAGRRQAALQGGAGPLEDAVDRFDRRVEHLGHLAGVVPEYVAQDQHGSAGERAEPAVRSRRPGRWLRSARSGPPGRSARRSHLRAGRPDTAPAIRLRRGGSARAVRHRGCPRLGPGVGSPSEAR